MGLTLYPYDALSRVEQEHDLKKNEHRDRVFPTAYTIRSSRFLHRVNTFLCRNLGRVTGPTTEQTKE